MAELTLLLPEARTWRLEGDLARWLARGDLLPTAPPGRDALLRENFEFTGTDVPVAALTRSIDSTDARGLWLRADPAWIMADAVTLRLMACGELGLTDEEAAALARTLKPLCGDSGLLLEATTAARWYLRCPDGLRLPRFSPPDAALGADVAGHLPDGNDSRQWRHLLNEIQVVLHHHPVNEARARRGAVPVNSLWFWGGGALPDWVRSRHTRVFSDDIVGEALARLAAAAHASVQRATPGDVERNDSVLVDLAQPAPPAAAVSAWLDTVRMLLEERRIDVVLLAFADGTRCRYRRAHRWRWWRRIAPAG